MKKIAYVLMAVGVLLAVIAFNLDVTVEDSGIVNMNMMAQRQNLLIVGCVGFLGGIILLIGTLKQGGVVTMRAEPEQGSEQEDSEVQVPPVKSAVLEYWQQQAIGSKLILASAPLILLSFCFSWEVASNTFADGPHDTTTWMIGISRALVALLLWVYPCLVTAAVVRPHINGMAFNGIAAALWMGWIAYRFDDVHEYMTKHEHIDMSNGFGFWLGLLAVLLLVTGIFKVVTGTFVDPDDEQAASEV